MKLIAIFTLTVLFFSSSESMQSDSTNVSELTDRIDVLESQSSTHKSKVDSLESILMKHQIKESFFSSTLSNQTGIFSLIVLALLTVATFANWGILYRHRKELKKEIEENDKKFAKYTEDLEEKNNTLRLSTLLSLNKLTLLIAWHEKDLNYRWYIHLISLDYASNYLKLAEELDKTDTENYEYIVTNLEISLDILIGDIDKLNDPKEALGSILFKNVEYLSAIKDGEISKKAKKLVGVLYSKSEPSKE